MGRSVPEGPAFSDDTSCNSVLRLLTPYQWDEIAQIASKFSPDDDDETLTATSVARSVARKDWKYPFGFVKEIGKIAYGLSKIHKASGVKALVMEIQKIATEKNRRTTTVSSQRRGTRRNGNGTFESVGR